MTGRRLAWAGWAATVLVGAVAATYLALTGGVDPGQEPTSVLQDALLLVAAVTFATAGALIGHHQPRNAIAWLFLAVGLVSVVQEAGAHAAVYSCVVAPGGRCLVELAVLADAIWFPTVTVGMVGLFLLFPNGELRGRWRRWLFGVIVAAGAGGAAAALVAPGVYYLDGLANPWHADVPGLAEIGEASGLVVLLALVTVGDFVVRARRSRGVERAQHKWLAAGGVAVLAGGLVSAAGSALTGVDLGATWPLALAFVPAAVAVAVARYRLYEIDRIVSRTLSYAAVAGVLAAAYVATIATLTTLLPSQSSLAVAAATLAAAALFNPARRRIQTAVDHRFNRARYDAQRVVDDFAASLRGRVDPDEVVAGWVGTVRRVVQPATVSVWVRPT